MRNFSQDETESVVVIFAEFAFGCKLTRSPVTNCILAPVKMSNGVEVVEAVEVVEVVEVVDFVTVGFVSQAVNEPYFHFEFLEVAKSGRLQSEPSSSESEQEEDARLVISELCTIWMRRAKKYPTRQDTRTNDKKMNNSAVTVAKRLLPFLNKGVKR